MRSVLPRLKRWQGHYLQIVFFLKVFLYGMVITFSIPGFCSDLFAKEEEFQEYLFPVIGPDIDLTAGYSFIDLKGPSRTGEYEYLHYSPYLGGYGVYFYFPHRLNLDVEFKNRKDYYSDVSYSYKDLIFFRGISRSIFHNLDNITPVAFDPLTGSPSTDIRDSGEVYGIRSGIHSLFLRFKTPDYPFHIYVDGRIVYREGIRQQMGLLGSGYFNDISISSKRREIDWRYHEITLGTNSHLGPLEVDLSHGESRFNVKGDNILFDRYSSAGFAPPLLREAGVYPRNLIPEIKGSSNTIKVHTAYTGSIVASGIFSKIEKENRESGARAEYIIGSGDVMWMPMPRLTFFIKYRHREKDMDIPSTVTISNMSDPFNSYTYILRDAISSASNTMSVAIRYRPIRGLNIRVEYTFEDLKRDFAALWGLPSSTERHNLSLSADMRIHRTMNIKARFIHKETNNPAYNYEPDDADEARLSLTWTPHTNVNAFISYVISEERRNDIYFRNTDSFGGRDVKKSRFMGNLTFLIMNNLSLTASYSYIHNRTVQDITMETFAPHYSPVKDSMIPYKDSARNYGLDINYEPGNNITFSGGLNYTISHGLFYTALEEFSGISGLSELKAREIVYSLNSEYRLRGGLNLGLKYRYTTVRDIIDNPNDDISNGRAHIILLTLTKKWK